MGQGAAAAAQLACRRTSERAAPGLAGRRWLAAPCPRPPGRSPTPPALAHAAGPARLPVLAPARAHELAAPARAAGSTPAPGAALRAGSAGAHALPAGCRAAGSAPPAASAGASPPGAQPLSSPLAGDAGCAAAAAAAAALRPGAPPRHPPAASACPASAACVPMKRAAPPVWPQVVPALPSRVARVRPSSSGAPCTESDTGLRSCWPSAAAVRCGPRPSKTSPCDPTEAGAPQHAPARGAMARTGPRPLVASSSRHAPTEAATAASRCSAASKLAHSACKVCTNTFVLPHFCSQAQLSGRTERTSSRALAAASMHVATTPHAQALLATAYSAALSAICNEYAVCRSKSSH
jgi:hypothetical protein